MALRCAAVQLPNGAVGVRVQSLDLLPFIPLKYSLSVIDLTKIFRCSLDMNPWYIWMRLIAPNYLASYEFVWFLVFLVQALKFEA